MNTDGKYNGYTNYETWCIALWFSNSADTEMYWLERARQVYADAVATAFATRTEFAIFELAREMQEHFEEEASDAGLQGALRYLLGATLARVSWAEVAKNWVDGILVEEDL
jgi:hypothetical protein